MGDKDEKCLDQNCQTNNTSFVVHPQATKLVETSNTTHVVLAKEEGEEPRETWNKKIDFLFSVIGFSVDLANVWRFPYLCYKNGGGAFLVPYLLMFFCGGVPLFYMELALGQYYRKGAITCWGRVCPIFKGIGWAVVLIAFYTDFFYNVVIAWSLHFFFASFTGNLPWDSCNNEWNTPACYEGMGPPPSGNATNMTGGALNVSLVGNLTGNVTAELQRVSPAHEYFERGMLQLHKSNGIFAIGQINWQLMLCLLGVYLICYFSLWKGISTSGKVVWFTALFPYVGLFILLIRGATLPGAGDGVRYYVTPKFDRLMKSEVWIDAATQVFFSLGPGFGVLLAFASYNKPNNNVYRDALMTSTINCLTSFFAGFVIFMILGYMAKMADVDIDKVATEGPGLVFEAYPMAISTLPGSTFWAIIFFLMLLTLGLDSSFGGSEAIITALSDEFPILKKHREWFVLVLFAVYFIIGLSFVAQGGAYVVTLMDRYAAGYSILFAVFFETIAVSWAYGVERFSDDIETMIGIRPGVYWRSTWKYIAPVFLMFIMIFGLVMYEPLQYDDYTYPTAANAIGWCIALSSILCIPGMAVYQIIITPGTLPQRMKTLLTPYRDSAAYESELCSDAKINGGNPVHV